MNIGDAVARLIDSAKKIDGWLDNTTEVSSVPELRENIMKANEDGLQIVPFRSGRTQDIDLMDRIPLDISQIKPEIDIRPERLTASVGSAMMVEDLNMALNSVNMKIEAIDGFESVSIGGLVAMGLSLPHRLPGRLNTSLIGLEVIDSNGDEFFTGRRTLKGVAGYHLNSIYIASFGRYGYIKNLIFRMNPEEEVSKVLSVKLQSIDDYIKLCSMLNRLSSYRGSIFVNSRLALTAFNRESPVVIIWLSGSSYAVSRAKDALMSEIPYMENSQIKLNTLTEIDLDFVKEGVFILCAKLSSENVYNIKNIEDIPYIIRSDGLLELMIRMEDVSGVEDINGIEIHSIYYKSRNRLLMYNENSSKSIHL
jgi:hypothetical protein